MAKKLSSTKQQNKGVKCTKSQKSSTTTLKLKNDDSNPTIRDEELDDEEFDHEEFDYERTGDGTSDEENTLSQVKPEKMKIILIKPDLSAFKETNSRRNQDD